MSRCLCLSSQALMFFTASLAFAQPFNPEMVRLPPPVDASRPPPPPAWNAQQPPTPAAGRNAQQPLPPAAWNVPPPPTNNAGRPPFSWNAQPNTATPALHDANSQRSRVALAARQEPVVPRPIPMGPPVPPPDSLPAPVQMGSVPLLPSTTFTLDQLTEIAEQQNPILERSEAEIEAAMGERVQAALYPNGRNRPPAQVLAARFAQDSACSHHML